MTTIIMTITNTKTTWGKHELVFASFKLSQQNWWVAGNFNWFTITYPKLCLTFGFCNIEVEIFLKYFQTDLLAGICTQSLNLIHAILENTFSLWWLSLNPAVYTWYSSKFRLEQETRFMWWFAQARKVKSFVAPFQRSFDQSGELFQRTFLVLFFLSNLTIKSASTCKIFHTVNFKVAAKLKEN